MLVCLTLCQRTRGLSRAFLRGGNDTSRRSSAARNRAVLSAQRSVKGSKPAGRALVRPLSP